MKPHKGDTQYALSWKYALIVFLIALSFRGIYLIEASGRPDFNLVYMDEEYNLEWAKGLATGVHNPPYDRLQASAYFRAPFYSYFLAGILVVSGSDMLVVRILQIIMGAVSCVLAYGLATKVLGQRIGLFAGVLCSLYWVLTYFDTQFLLPVLLVFLLLLGMLLAFLAVERRSTALAGLSGLSLGLYSITRPNILVFFPFFAWWAFTTWGRSRPHLSRWFVILTILGVCLPPAVVTLRNRIVADDWVLIASQGGVNFYIGNNPESTGMQAVVPGTRQTWWGGYEDTRRIAEEAAGHTLKASEVSDYWFQRAFAYISADPTGWLRLSLRKAAALVGDVEIPNNEPYEAYRQEFVSLRMIPLSFAVIFGLFLVSLPLLMKTQRARRRRKAHLDGARFDFMILMLALVVVYSLSIIAFFVTGRYRVPLIPFFAIGAAVTAIGIHDYLRSRAVKTVAVVIIACVGIISILSIDHLGVRRATAGFAQLTIAQNRIDAGDLDGGIEGLEHIRSEGSVQAPEVFKALARAYLERGGPEDQRSAFEVSEDGLRHYPDEAELLWYSAVGHFDSNNWAQARDRLARLLVHEPKNIRALYLGFVTALAVGDREEAESYLTRAEEVDPEHPMVRRMRQSGISP